MVEIQPARVATLKLLADGQWHSGVAMGRSLGLSRAAIWKQVAALRELGMTIFTDRRRGYRLEHLIDLFNADRIRAGLKPTVREAVEVLEVLTVTDSTNCRLTSRPAPPPGRLWVVIADYQTGGRGRRGRRWLSPLGHGICLSVARTFVTTPRELPSLSLVAGVAVADGLAHLGIEEVQLKWPNDVMAAGGKLGGILVEVAGEPGGPLRVVIGIGLNVRPIESLAAALSEERGDAPAAALDQMSGERRLNRSDVVAALLNALHVSLQNFETDGWASMANGWQQRDFLAGRPVVVTRGAETVHGIARGIAEDGALFVDVGGKLTTVVAGDVTLRAGTDVLQSGMTPVRM
ncbi:MAG: biotin--[acetyl-CoA-carboxylase] ligase [Gammaproteobacteria bacterium]